MLALPGLLLLVFVDFLRPQEYFAALRGVPLLHLAVALAAFGFVLDLRLGLSRLRPAPHLVATVLFVLWCLTTVAVRAPDQLGARAMALLIPFAIYLLLSHAVQSFRSLEALGALLLGIAVCLAVLGVHQGLSSTECHRLVPREGGGDPLYIRDGRPCVQRVDCTGEDAEPGSSYACEKTGLLGTSSIHGRVRYRGSMEDPNDLSLALGIAIPLAFAFYDRSRSLARLLLVLVTVALAGLCAIFTQSRGGQLVFLAVLAVFFVKRVGVRRGLAVGLALALPMLLLGGRSGGESSTYERTVCWWVGMHLFADFPLAGVGYGQFMEHHRITAHSSHVLAAAELGLPGLVLWVTILYLAAKIPLEAQRAHAHVARSWGLGLFASLAGLVVGITFLSHTYKDITWIYLSLSGVLYQAVKQHDPAFEVRFGRRDAALVGVISVGLLATHFGYTAYKVGW